MEIKKIFEQYQGKPIVRGAALVLVVFIVAVIIRVSNSTAVVGSPESTAPQVETTTAGAFSGSQSLSLIGTVRAFTEAEITAERAGRVVRVNTTLGSRVAAGQVIASLENASEQAAVLQAEGVYEAAIAASAQSTVGVTDAENNIRKTKTTAISNMRSAYNTTNGIILNSLDQFFASPNAPLPGLRIDGKGNTMLLNNERVTFQSMLPEWQGRTNTATLNSDLVKELEYSLNNVSRTISMIDTFITVFNSQNSSRYTDAELQSFSSSFTSLRATLIGTQSSLTNSISAIQTSEDALARAKISASGGTSSAADAQIKQALGSLRAAQANLAKTILRTPISGTVNSLSIKTGDYIAAQTKVSVVANNSALEIVTFVGDSELEQLTIGDTVMIEDEYEGIVTQIAPAIDSVTRKTEVRIATEDTKISNGDTVRITKSEQTPTETIATTVWVPLTAIKFSDTAGHMFSVVDNVLTKKDVELGVIRGTSVEITNGLELTDTFVVDVRGLTEGDEVTVKN